MRRVDYDQIADVYDEPARDHGVDEKLAAYLERRPAARDATSVLDLGCGTGKWIAANGARWPAVRLIGLDRSRAMLGIARRLRSSAGWVCADAGQLPLPDRRVDYVACNYAYAHFEDKAGFLREVFRVLRPGGRLVVTNIDPWAMPAWLLYRWFPAAREIDERDFVRREAFVGLLEDVGFRDTRFEETRIVESVRLRDFLQRVSSRSSASQLMAISDEAYQEGIHGLTEATARERPPFANGEPSEACIIHFLADA